MRLFGLDISRASRSKALAPIDANRGGWFRVMESFPGAWQQNVTVDYNSALSNTTLFACLTLIASDVSKLRVKLVERKDIRGIWEEVENPAYSPVLRKPNSYQTRIQFLENWMLSKLCRGNTYALKQRDQRGVVTALYILDPNRVQVLVSDDGSVFYDLQPDNLTAQDEHIVVPAREIIHDRFNCLFHPLVGVSPIFAAGLAAVQGLRIQENSAVFFGNKSMPGGILTAPGAIADATAVRLKEAWDTNYSGANRGKVAVLGDGLKFEAVSVTAENSQLVEQLKMSGEVICSAFHVPPYKVGLGVMPTNNNVQALNVEYYSQCLQTHIEAAEVCLDEGLGMGVNIGTEFDLDGLLRMDALIQMDVLEKSKGKLTVNEMRFRLGYGPQKGGETVYLQEQDHSLEALAKRDAREDPFAKGAPAPAALPPPVPAIEPDDGVEDDAEAKGVLFAGYLRREMGLAA